MKTRYFVLIAVCAYLLYTPVPDGLVEPWKYRALMVPTQFLGLIAKAQDLIWPDAPNDVLLYRNVMQLMTGNPALEEPGSNFKARVTQFDGVKVRVYEPIQKPESLLTGFVYFHGGGFSFGSTELYDGLTRKIADTLNAVVVSVDYRLSPEYPFPIPVEDCLKAAKWFLTHAKEFGVDPKRVGLGGDSAGGWMTAIVTQLLHKEKIKVKVQMMVYPAISAMDSSAPSYQKYQYEFGYYGMLPLTSVARAYSYFILGKKSKEFEQSYIENKHVAPSQRQRDSMKTFFNHSLIPPEMRLDSYYKGPSDPNLGSESMWNKIKDVCLDSRFSAFNNLPLNGLPPAYIITCGFDSIRDDGIFYGEALKAAGVEVTWKHYEEGFHGIFWESPAISFELGEKMQKEAMEYVKAKL